MKVGDLVLWRPSASADAWFIGKVLTSGGRMTKVAEWVGGQWTLSGWHVGPAQILGVLPEGADPVAVRERLRASLEVLTADKQAARAAHLARVEEILK